jgi:hypothetical protein
MGTSLTPETAVAGVGDADLISWTDTRLRQEIGQARLRSNFSSSSLLLLAACWRWLVGLCLPHTWG